MTEREVVASAWAQVGQERADKFVSEVLWRTDWKGWLQMRPEVWDRCRTQVPRDRDGLGADDRASLDRARSGNTGIARFDHWCRELLTTGYLHNHARMWFASIWVFTLRLPWTLGAELFLRHLLDGDPASNTLSWRWVAGLHTKYKHYLARADNIARYTRERFNPVGELDEQARALPADGWGETRIDLPASTRPDPTAKALLIVHQDDLLPERSPLSRQPSGAVVGLGDGVLRPDHRVGPLPQAFNADAPDDALARCEAHSRTPAFRLDDAIWHQRVIEHARTNGLTEAVCLFAPAGDWAAALNGLEASFNEASIDLIRVQRDWDTALWPGARRGFFPLRKHAHHGGLLERLAQAGDLPK